jgi:hypothetical protein
MWGSIELDIALSITTGLENMVQPQEKRHVQWGKFMKMRF